MKIRLDEPRLVEMRIELDEMSNTGTMYFPVVLGLLCLKIFTVRRLKVLAVFFILNYNLAPLEGGRNAEIRRLFRANRKI
ncbi:MAG: hypothetical protein ACOC1W_03820 [Bacillota bacterium]